MGRRIGELRASLAGSAAADRVPNCHDLVSTRAVLDPIRWSVMNGRPYRDRREAGRAVAGHLAHHQARADVLVLALPHGGVPVAAEVARALDAPLDVLIVRKITVRDQPEFAIGATAAVAGRVETVWNEQATTHLRQKGWDDDAFERLAAPEREELDRRQRAYRNGRSALALGARTVVLVDDGLATGSTMRAAIAVMRQEEPRALIAAVPVGSHRAVDAIGGLVDELVCPWTPEPFWAVGQAYESFEQTTDDEVRQILRSAAAAGEG